MDTWDLGDLDVVAHKPQILSSSDAARVIAINLPAGEALDEHEVHERAWLVVLGGEIEVAVQGADRVTGGRGLVAEFEPHELHAVHATTDARLLLFLAPWPGEGHPGAMSLEEKAHVRERAADHGSG